MAQVDVTINGRDYQIACDDGQEAHLVQLGEYVDRRVKELATAVGQVGDSRLLVMSSLLIADELAETYAELKQTNEAVEGASSSTEIEDRLAEIVESVAARIEAATVGLTQTANAAE